MIIRVCTFTRQGEKLVKELFEGWPEMILQQRDPGSPLEKWTGDCFERHLPILFIGACGIAVRAIAPFVRDKLSDSAVLVMDERGRYVIPVLSGHMGGANELAGLIAKRIGAEPVLTTATDVEGLFSVDLFAKENGLSIQNREGIRLVSGKLLRGEKVTVAWDERIEVSQGQQNAMERLGLIPVSFEKETADVRIILWEDAGKAQAPKNGLCLAAKDFVIGMGCKKGKAFEELEEFLMKNAPKGWEERTCGIASVDLKAGEEGLWELAQFYHLPLSFFSSEELLNVPGDFTESEFVKNTTGVGNVCERAAVALAGEGAEMLLKKTAENGMTLAVARRRVRLTFQK